MKSDDIRKQARMESDGIRNRAALCGGRAGERENANDMGHGCRLNGKEGRDMIPNGNVKAWGKLEAARSVIAGAARYLFSRR